MTNARTICANWGYVRPEKRTVAAVEQTWCCLAAFWPPGNAQHCHLLRTSEPYSSRSTSPYSDLNSEIIAAIDQAVPDGATFGFNHDYRRTWVTVTKPGNTRDVLHAAFASLGRDLPDDPGEG